MALRHILPGAGKPGVIVGRYSIVRVGREYVVRADEKSILKIASRRRAANRTWRQVFFANGLLAGLPWPCAAL